MTKATLFLFLCATLVARGQQAPSGAQCGAFEKRCSGCHGLDEAKVGPALRGIFGHNAANDPKFQYSDALRKANLKWDETTLDRWLTDPDSLVPGNDMPFRLQIAADRKAIIDYLKSLSPGSKSLPGGL